MGIDTSVLYSQYLQLSRQNHIHPSYLARPHSNIPPAFTPKISEISLITPRRDKVETGLKGSQITPYAFNNSYIGAGFFRDQTPQRNIQRTKSLTAINPLQYSQINPNFSAKQSRVVPSILKREAEKGFEKILKIDPYHEEINMIRGSLRASKGKITEAMKPHIMDDIEEMNLAISNEKNAGLGNKGRVLFILAQKNHYQKLVDKLQDNIIKIDGIINTLRRQDIVPLKSLQQMKSTTQSIAKLLSNVEKDLPNKSWKVVLQQPDSKLYQLVVMKATKSEQIKKQLSDLERTDVLTSSHASSNGTMLFSNTYRLGSPHPGMHNTSELKNISNISGISKSSSNSFLKQDNSLYEDSSFSMVKKNSGSENMNFYQKPQPMRQSRYPFGEINKF